MQKPRVREKWLLPMDHTMPMPWYWTSRQVFDARASLNQRAKLLGFSQLCKAPELNPEGLLGLSEKNSIGKQHSSRFWCIWASHRNLRRFGLWISWVRWPLIEIPSLVSMFSRRQVRDGCSENLKRAQYRCISGPDRTLNCFLRSWYSMT